MQPLSISRSVLICLKDNDDAQELETSGGEASGDKAMPPVAKAKVNTKVSNEPIQLSYLLFSIIGNEESARGQTQGMGQEYIHG